jgi:hypothetical protein
LASDGEWAALAQLLDAPKEGSTLKTLCDTFRRLGAQSFLIEEAYIDRDFSAAFSAFYAALFRPGQKYCRRIHFFTAKMEELVTSATAEEIARELETKRDGYLGHIVLRPLTHAPVGSALVSVEHLGRGKGRCCDISAHYEVHVLGADLKVEGVPLTQQDRRVGSCAQAAVWSVGRHFNRRHGGPWFSLADISEAALKPTDDVVTRSLPAGSEYLRPLNIVRALRAMDRHPVVHGPWGDATAPNYPLPPHEVINRYLDSGIPVILGLRGEKDGPGHAVVAVGRDLKPAGSIESQNRPTWAELTQNFLVHDDQLGSHCALPVREADRHADYAWTVENDVTYAIVPLPDKVFMTADVAEKIARENLENIVADRARYVERARAGEHSAKFDANIDKLDADFYGAEADGLVARTYLTYGWKYKRRALRNRFPDQFKTELLTKQFPRYVWVTEFSLPSEADAIDVCAAKVRAHVVIDATGSKFWDSALVLQIPGLSIFWTFNPAEAGAVRRLIFRLADKAEPFLPKTRGWEDFDACDLPKAQQISAA